MVHPSSPGRFIHFGTIEVHIWRLGFRDRYPDVFAYLEPALEPILGSAEDGSREGICLRYHPINHPNCCSEADDVGWADYLDGIRLEWNKDAIHAGNSEAPASAQLGKEV